jgi:hypothetical protein
MTEQALTFFGEPLKCAFLEVFELETKAGDTVRVYTPAWSELGTRWLVVYHACGWVTWRAWARDPHRGLRELESHIRVLARRLTALCGWELDES